MKEKEFYKRVWLSVSSKFTKVIVGLCLSTLFFPGIGYCEDVCGDKVYINITTEKSCGPAPGPYPGPLDQGCTAPLKESSCGIAVYTVCCPVEVTINYSDDEYASIDVTGVLLGEESAVADVLFTNFQRDHSYRAAKEGYVLTGYMEGGVWVTEQGTVPGTVKLRWSGWKRGAYKRSGAEDTEIMPIENITSGGEYTGGVFGEEVNSEFQFVPSEAHNKNLGDTVNYYKQAMLQTGIGSLIGNFAGGIPSSYGSTAISFTTGRLGNHSFNFADYNYLWAVLGSILLVVISYVCIKIIFKGGGG